MITVNILELYNGKDGFQYVKKTKYEVVQSICDKLYLIFLFVLILTESIED